MSQPEHHFRVVLRGYDPTDVDRVLGDLDARLTKAEREARALRGQLEEARAAREGNPARAAPVAPATFEHLGARVGQILGLAEAEAAELRDAARAELEALRKDAEQAAVAVRDEADRYADQRRRDADLESSPGAHRRPPRRGRGAGRRRAGRIRAPPGGGGDPRGAAGERRPGGGRLRDHPGRTSRPDHGRVPGAAGGDPGPARRDGGPRRRGPRRGGPSEGRCRGGRPLDRGGGQGACRHAGEGGPQHRRPGPRGLRPGARGRVAAPRQHQRPALQRPPDAADPLRGGGVRSRAGRGARGARGLHTEKDSASDA